MSVRITSGLNAGKTLYGVHEEINEYGERVLVDDPEPEDYWTGCEDREIDE